MKSLRLFISSPGDVSEERQIAGRVIERLQGKYWSFVRLDDVFWETRVVRSTAHYQDELVNPGKCDIVVGLLWSRLGSPLPPTFQRQNGERWESGTEWELEMAFDAYEENLKKTGDPKAAKPDIVVYRRREKRIKRDDPDKETEAARQEEKLNAYLEKSYFFPEEKEVDSRKTIKRPIIGYRLEQFEKKLYGDLEELILRQIPELTRNFDPPPISGCPFKELKAFDFHDEDRFFGRNREIRDVQFQLRARREDGEPAFVLIYGGSGYGKSSLMRAGVAPVICRNGGVEDNSNDWRRVLFQPTRGSGSLTARFVRHLLSEPEDQDRRAKEADSSFPQSGIAELSQAIDSGHAGDLSKSKSETFARQLENSEHCFAAVTLLQSWLAEKNTHLLIQIDQLEEVMRAPFTDEERKCFFRALQELCRCENIWGLATLRSDHFAGIAETPFLSSIIGSTGGYILRPPGDQMLSEVIRFPALAARLTFETKTEPLDISGEPAISDSLSDQIFHDSNSSTGALPLLEFCLTQLYVDTLVRGKTGDDELDSLDRERKHDVLRWERYQEIGGIKGSIASAADDVIGALRSTMWNDQVRNQLFGKLVRVDSATGEASRQRADLKSFRNSSSLWPVVEALRKARLLVTDVDETDVIFLAHDALLTHWAILSYWIDENRSDLEAHERLSRLAGQWDTEGQVKGLLLSENRLAEAERVRDSGVISLTAQENEFLNKSRKRSTGRLRFFQAATGIFAIVAISAAILGWLANLKSKEADANAIVADKNAIKAKENATEAERRAVEAEREKENARAEAGKAFLLQANSESDTTDSIFYAGLAIGFKGLDNGNEDTSDFANLFAPERFQKHALQAQRIIEEAKVFPAIWGSPYAAQHRGAITQIAAGEVGFLATGSEDNTVKIWKTGERLEQFHLALDSTFFNQWINHLEAGLTRPKPATIRIRREHEEEIKIFSDFPFYQTDPLGVTALAWETGGTRIASGGERGELYLWDLKSPKKSHILLAGGPNEPAISAVRFTPKGNELWSINVNGSIQLWDTTTGESRVKFNATGKVTATASAFGPDGSWVVNGEADGSIEIWSLNTDFTGSEITPPKPQIELQMGVDHMQNESSSVKLVDSGVAELSRSSAGRNEVVSLTASQDGKMVAAGFMGGEIKIWDVETGTSRLAARVPFDKTTIAVQKVDASGKLDLSNSLTFGYPVRLSFSADSQDLHVTTSEKRILTWNLEDGNTDPKVTKLPFNPTAICWDPEHSEVLVGYRERYFGPVSEEPASQEQPAANTTSLSRVIWSPDGSQFATGSHDGRIRFFDSASRKQVREFSPGLGPIRSMDWSPNGKLIAAGFWQKAMLWDAKTGKVISKIGIRSDEGGMGSFASDVSFSPDSKWLASAITEIQRTSKVTFLNCEAGKFEHSIELPHRGNTHLAWNPDSSRLLCGGGEGQMSIWMSETGKKAGDRKVFQDGNRFTSAAWSPDGKSIIFGDTQGQINFYDGENLRFQNRIKNHSAHVNSLDFIPDGSAFISASDDGEVKLWDSRGYSVIATFRGHGDGVTDAAWSPDTKEIVSVGRDGKARLWKSTIEESIARFGTSGIPYRCIAASPDGNQFVVGNLAGDIEIFDRSTGEVTDRFERRHTGALRDVAWSPDGHYIASLCAMGETRIWDATTLQMRRESDAFTNGLDQASGFLQFSPDSTRLLIGNIREYIQLWNHEEDAAPRSIYERRSSQTGISHAAFSPLSGDIAFVTSDGLVRLWSKDKNEVSRPVMPEHFVIGVSWKKSDRLVTYSRNGSVQTWDLEEGSLISSVPFSEKMDRIFVDPTGTRFAFSHDKNVVVHSIDGKEAPRVFHGHKIKPNNYSWSSQNPAHLFSTDESGTISEWNTLADKPDLLRYFDERTSRFDEETGLLIWETPSAPFTRDPMPIGDPLDEIESETDTGQLIWQRYKNLLFAHNWSAAALVYNDLPDDKKAIVPARLTGLLSRVLLAVTRDDIQDAMLKLKAWDRFAKAHPSEERKRSIRDLGSAISNNELVDESEIAALLDFFNKEEATYLIAGIILRKENFDAIKEALQLLKSAKKEGPLDWNSFDEDGLRHLLSFTGKKTSSLSASEHQEVTESLIAVAPTSPEALFHKGIIAQEKGNHLEAIDFLHRAFSTITDPFDPFTDDYDAFFKDFEKENFLVRALNAAENSFLKVGETVVKSRQRAQKAQSESAKLETASELTHATKIVLDHHEHIRMYQVLKTQLSAKIQLANSATRHIALISTDSVYSEEQVRKAKAEVRKLGKALEAETAAAKALVELSGDLVTAKILVESINSEEPLQRDKIKSLKTRIERNRSRISNWNLKPIQNDFDQGPYLAIIEPLGSLHLAVANSFRSEGKHREAVSIMSELTARWETLLPFIEKQSRLVEAKLQRGRSSAHGNLANFALFDGDLKRAIQHSKIGFEARPQIWIAGNLATALILNGEVEKAKDVLKEYRGRPVFGNKGDPTIEAIVSDDLKNLESVGVAHPDSGKVLEWIQSEDYEKDAIQFLKDRIDREINAKKVFEVYPNKEIAEAADLGAIEKIMLPEYGDIQFEWDRVEPEAARNLALKSLPKLGDHSEAKFWLSRSSQILMREKPNWSESHILHGIWLSRETRRGPEALDSLYRGIEIITDGYNAQTNDSTRFLPNSDIKRIAETSRWVKIVMERLDLDVKQLEAWPPDQANRNIKLQMAQSYSELGYGIVLHARIQAVLGQFMKQRILVENITGKKVAESDSLDKIAPEAQIAELRAKLFSKRQIETATTKLHGFAASFAKKSDDVLSNLPPPEKFSREEKDNAIIEQTRTNIAQVLRWIEQ